MITKEEAYKKAFETKKQRLSENQRTYETLRSAAYSSNPRLAEIDKELSGIGSLLVLGNAEKFKELREKSQALALEKKVLLAEVGIGELHYDCRLCNDTGYINGKICSCVKKLASEITAAEFSKDMPLDECRFDNFDLKFYSSSNDKNGNNPKRRMTAIYKTCLGYAMNFDPKNSGNLLFMGSAGLGKTHLSLAIVSAVIEKGYNPVYSSAENLSSAAEKEKFSDKNIGFTDEVLGCDLLVIDDLGAEFSTPFSKAFLCNTINTRIMSKKPTVISTNLSMKEIEQRYTARLSSRLIGSFDARLFLGKDIRQQKSVM